MLSFFVYAVPFSNFLPLLSPPCLTTVSKECWRNRLRRRTLRTPVFRRSASVPLSAASTHFRKHRGVHRMTTINHTSRRTPLSNSWQDRVGPQHCFTLSLEGCAPACPAPNPTSLCFFPALSPRLSLPSPSVSFLFASFPFVCSRLPRSYSAGVNETRPHS